MYLGQLGHVKVGQASGLQQIVKDRKTPYISIIYQSSVPKYGIHIFYYNGYVMIVK